MGYILKVLLEMGERVEGGRGKQFWKIMAGVRWGKLDFEETRSIQFSMLPLLSFPS